MADVLGGLSVSRRSGGNMTNDVYVYWESLDGSEGTLVKGREIPCYVNGTPMFSRSEVRKVYEIYAATPEEASAVHNLRMGFGAYHPMGKAHKCPKKDCSGHYYLGSGNCFCGYSYDQDK